MSITDRVVRAGGSSPLARGLRGRHSGSPSPCRIIPARAGFTSRRCRWCAPWADHPRSRGVYSTDHCSVSSRSGSSPLARGLLRLVQHAREPRRIIPARAGFTSVCGLFSRASRDHPRSRGVYRHSLPTEGRSGGSSPLARGLQGDTQAQGQEDRIIPARAGFTARVS